MDRWDCVYCADGYIELVENCAKAYGGYYYMISVFKASCGCDQNGEEDAAKKSQAVTKRIQKEVSTPGGDV